MKKTTRPLFGPAPLLLLACGLPFLPTSASAEVLAYEGFDYPAASAALPGKTGGFGWGGAWQMVFGGSNDIVGSSLFPFTAPPDFDSYSTGNSIFLPNGRRDGRTMDTSATGPFGSRGLVDGAGRIGADGKTLYVSFLQRSSGTALFYEFEFHRDGLDDPTRIAGIGNDVAGDNVNLRAPAGTHSVIAAGDTEVNFYVMRIDFKPGNDDVRVYRNPTTATEPAAAELTLPAQADMSFTGIAVGAFANGITVSHDEIRFGETWTDAIGAGVNTQLLPAITAAPQAVRGYTGGSAKFSVQVTGNPDPTLQWFKGSTAIDGATEATLTLDNLLLSNAGDYKVTATNAKGSVTTTPVALTVVAPPAGLLAYEGFDYPVGNASLAGQTGGFGWNAPWEQVDGGSDNVVSGSLTAPFAPNSYAAMSTGNSVFLPNGRRDGRYLNTTPAGPFASRGLLDEFGRIGATGKTLYVSFMQQANGPGIFYELEFHQDGLGDATRTAGIGNDVAGSSNVNLRAPGGTHSPIGTGNTDVNFYVMRIDFKDGSDDVRVYRNPVGGTEPAAADLQLPEQADLSFNAISLGAFANGRTVAHDEIRLGETWAAVAGVANATAPVILVAPEGAAVYAGANVTLTAVIGGTPSPAYQWYRGTTPLTGQTGAQLSLPNVQVASAGFYKVTATNSVGAVTTTPVELKVASRPADVIAYEGFEYPAADASLAGKSGGFGWATAWQQVHGGTDNVVEGSLTAVSAPSGYDAQSRGNSVFLPNGRRDGRWLDTTPEGPFGALGLLDDFGRIGADGKTLYLSFLQAPSTTAYFYEFEFHRDGLGDLERTAGIGNDIADGNTVNLRAPADVHTPIGDGSTEVNFYVMRIDFKPDNDDVRIYRNPTVGAEPAEADLMLAAQADLSFNAISMGAFAGSTSVAHDEIRFGRTWASVTGGGAAVNAAYTQWLTGFTFPAGADQSHSGDPDQDGITNLLEFGFATNPTIRSSAPVQSSGAAVVAHGVPTVSGTAPSGLSGVFGRRKNASTAGLTYTAQFSADLITWQNSTAVPAVSASDADIDIVSLPWPATVPTASGNAAPRFFRVRLTAE